MSWHVSRVPAGSDAQPQPPHSSGAQRLCTTTFLLCTTIFPLLSPVVEFGVGKERKEQKAAALISCTPELLESRDSGQTPHQTASELIELMAYAEVPAADMLASSESSLASTGHGHTQFAHVAHAMRSCSPHCTYLTLLKGSWPHFHCCDPKSAQN